MKGDMEQRRQMKAKFLGLFLSSKNRCQHPLGHPYYQVMERNQFSPDWVKLDHCLSVDRFPNDVDQYIE